MKHIAITVDKNYCIHAAVMMCSLLSNNNSANINVHIIVNFRNPFFKIPLIYILKKHKCNYRFYYISKEHIEFSDDLIITDHITIATYFRLFLPSILKDVDKVLFLDSDMIIDGNIDELYAVNINNHSLAAVFYENEERIATLSLLHGYFNAGMMLLNLKYFRVKKFELKFRDFIKEHPDKIRFWDQDVLNVVTQGSVLPVDIKWNFLASVYDNKNQPTIIHYAGTHKPWNVHYDKLFKDRYFEYLAKDRFLVLFSKILNYLDYFQTMISKIYK